jgi:hypothetical protein
MYAGRIPACPIGPAGTGLSGAPASPPAPARCAVAAPHPSYPLRGRTSASMRMFALRSWCAPRTNSKNWLQPTSCRPSCHFWAWGFRGAKTPGIETAGIHAGLKQRHPCGCSACEFLLRKNSWHGNSRHPCRPWRGLFLGLTGRPCRPGGGDAPAGRPAEGRTAAPGRRGFPGFRGGMRLSASGKTAGTPFSRRARDRSGIKTRRVFVGADSPVPAGGGDAPKRNAAYGPSCFSLLSFGRTDNVNSRACLSPGWARAGFRQGPGCEHAGLRGRGFEGVWR